MMKSQKRMQRTL